jgi:hypothetical protein
MNAREESLGVVLPNGCRVTHGHGARVKKPFGDLPVIMHELHGGTAGEGNDMSFRGQFGFIPFSADFRLPRHVHMAEPGGSAALRLIGERILVVNGAGLVELNGEVFLVAPGSLVHIEPGVPHSWTACPPGIVLPDGTATTGHFLMIYDYPERTMFYPTASTRPIESADAYRPFEGDLEAIRFPNMEADEIVQCVSFVWDQNIRTDLGRSE